jgi:hypothetical protein
MQPAQEAPDGLVAVLPIEVSGAEVTVGDAVPQDEVSGGEHGGGDGNDGLPGAPASLDALELGAQITGFGADGSPGGGDEGGLEPGAAFAQAGRATLPGAFVVSRAQASP